MHASRFPWDMRPTDFARAEEEARSRGDAILDLTGSNPTALGLAPGPEAFEPLPVASLARYSPDPRGALPARQAVAAYLAGHGSSIDAAQILLTASSSEAYSWLFKVLADPGQSVAIPEPSYPLFDFLTHLEGVRPLHYELLRAQDGRWRIDPDALEACLEAGARAVVVVQPSNPVGACLAADDRAALFERCGAHGAAMICDEVFLDYAGDTAAQNLTSLASLAASDEAAAKGVTLFVLSGASKVLCAPGLKLGWIALAGKVDPEQRARLELVADTFLSVSVAAQALVPGLLAARTKLQAPVQARLRENRAILAAALEACAHTRIVSEPAGWSAVLRLPAPGSSKAPWAEHLLGEAQVLVHPGYFYELSEREIVLSLLGDPQALRAGLERIVVEVEAVQASLS